MANMQYLVILNDGETWSALEGCTIVGIGSGNKAALEALDEEEMEAVLDLADIAYAIQPPVIESATGPERQPAP